MMYSNKMVILFCLVFFVLPNLQSQDKIVGLNYQSCDSISCDNHYKVKRYFFFSRADTSIIDTLISPNNQIISTEKYLVKNRDWYRIKDNEKFKIHSPSVFSGTRQNIEFEYTDLATEDYLTVEIKTKGIKKPMGEFFSSKYGVMVYCYEVCISSSLGDSFNHCYYEYFSYEYGVLKTSFNNSENSLKSMTFFESLINEPTFNPKR